jgi:hypothetical protein
VVEIGEQAITNFVQRFWPMRNMEEPLVDTMYVMNETPRNQGELMTDFPASHGFNHDSPEGMTITTAESELARVFPEPPKLNPSDIANLTPEQAQHVYRATRRALLFQLLYQEYHEHVLDDCGDYLVAALDNFHRLHMELFNNDFANAVETVQHFLNDFCAGVDDEDLAYPIQASDGDVRFSILPDPYDN